VLKPLPQLSATAATAALGGAAGAMLSSAGPGAAALQLPATAGRAGKVDTLEEMLTGMKGRLAELEARLMAELGADE
jgi:hypothetical protein